MQKSKTKSKKTFIVEIIFPITKSSKEKEGASFTYVSSLLNGLLPNLVIFLQSLTKTFVDIVYGTFHSPGPMHKLKNFNVSQKYKPKILR